MLKTRKCHRISLLVISMPVAIAEEFNRVYDLNGNLVTGDGFYREYNELNQLVRIRNSSSSGIILEEFVWHPVQEKILIKDIFKNGVRDTSIFYVSPEFIRIENSTGNYTEKYVYDGNTLLAQVNTNDNKEFLHNDHEGSTSLITDVNGNVLENTFYSPFGEILSGGKTSRFDSEGKEFDSVTQLYDFHFRMYNPQRPPFEQPDTLIQNVYDPQLLNHYAFERNSPFKYTDPTGHFVFYYGEVGSVGFGTGAQGAFGNVISFSLANGLQYGTYQRYGAGIMSPTASVSVEAGFSPFMKNINEFKGAFLDIGGDLGEGATLGVGISVPYDEKTKKFKPLNTVISVTGSLTDLNPPIGPVSGYGIYSNSIVNYRQSNNLRLSSSVLIQNEYLRYQSYFSDKKESSSGGGRGSGGGGGCRCGSWGSLREEAEKEKPGETAGDIIRRWRKKQ